MRGRRVLITGVSSFWGRELARRLETDESVEYLAGVDTKAPDGDLERTEFLEADIRSPVIAKLIPSTRVDTVIHTGIVLASEEGVSAAVVHDTNVVGTLQLLGACEKTKELKAIVVRGSAAIYGSESSAPSFFSEEMTHLRPLRHGFQRDIAELESYFETFSRRHSDVTCTMLRFQPTIGPSLDTPLVRYLNLPVVPTQLGFDPRLQFLHEEDGIAALKHAIEHPVRGPVNIAGEGTISLTRLLRLAGKVTLPVLPPLFDTLMTGATRVGVPALGRDFTALLRHGRGVDLRRMKEVMDFVPRFTTGEAVQDFIVKRSSRRVFGSAREAILSAV